ncbi:hypothetical protein MXD81_25805, partial [Microbacteriaceae bacterium K1510]|nr:hypothetical protein [Microbacteriaceae bacterium K1510]
KEGIAEQIDFLLRDPEIRNRANIFVSKGKAETKLELLPPLERYSAEVIREQSQLHLDLGVTLSQLLMMIRTETGAGAVP